VVEVDRQRLDPAPPPCQPVEEAVVLVELRQRLDPTPPPCSGSRKPRSWSSGQRLDPGATGTHRRSLKRFAAGRVATARHPVPVINSSARCVMARRLTGP
jgi:hypothetical protein